MKVGFPLASDIPSINGKWETGYGTWVMPVEMRMQMQMQMRMERKESSDHVMSVRLHFCFFISIVIFIPSLIILGGMEGVGGLLSFFLSFSPHHSR